MAIFDRNKIISNSENAELGKRYYFSTTLSHLEEVVKNNNTDYCDNLNKIENNLFFMQKGYFGWKYIYPYSN